jgi:WG containing repeat
MKTFLINIILPFVILFLTWMLLLPIAFIFTFLIESKTVQSVLTNAIALMCVVAIAFYLLKWLYNYWRNNSNYTTTYLIVLGSILGIFFIWYIYLTTRNIGKFNVDPDEHAVTNPDYKEELDDNVIDIAATITEDLLFAKQNSKTQLYGYYDSSGHKVLGDYEFIFTDTLTQYGIVQDKGYFLIDKTGKHYFEIYPFDNGPDYPSEGLCRIIENDKIGYADALTAQIVIQPQYDCAFPFEHGKAKVSLDCKTINEGEHSTWESKQWFYIDKKGKILIQN